MTSLLIDIGNTAVKIALLDNDCNIKPIIKMSSKKLPIKKKFYSMIDDALKLEDLQFKHIKYICLSSVRPMWDFLIEEFASYIGAKFYQVKKNIKLNDIKINIPNSQNLGADLIVLCYGANKEYINANKIIVSMGTATTISVIKNNAFEGAIIMPGLDITAEALFNNAQLLHRFDYKYENLLYGKNTKEAINLGIVNAHCYALRTSIDNILKDIKDDYVCILTGGYASFVIDYFKDCVYDELLLFKGLKDILSINK